MPAPGNLLADMPPLGADESFQALLTTPGFRVERIVSQGHASPAGSWYDQDDDEWVLLVSGSARLRLEGDEPVDLTPGSYLHLPAHRRHRVESTDPTRATVWLAIHFKAPVDERQAPKAANQETPSG
jgi:cupin 2 domain-containing protein